MHFFPDSKPVGNDNCFGRQLQSKPSIRLPQSIDSADSRTSSIISSSSNDGGSVIPLKSSRLNVTYNSMKSKKMFQNTKGENEKYEKTLKKENR